MRFIKCPVDTASVIFTSRVVDRIIEATNLWNGNNKFNKKDVLLSPIKDGCLTVSVKTTDNIVAFQVISLFTNNGD